jgi:hypothetical protein
LGGQSVVADIFCCCNKTDNSKNLHVVLNLKCFTDAYHEQTCPKLVANMLQMVVPAVRLRITTATAWGFTAAPDASAGNASSASLPQAPSQAHE